MSQELTGHFGLWELAILCFLREKPMHPYEIQRLLAERHKTDVLPLKRGSLYHAIGRLERAQLIEIVDTARVGRRPERTTYQITDAGLEAMTQWLRERIAIPQSEAPDLAASISFLVYLEPDDAVNQLEQRAARLETLVSDLDATIRLATPHAGRINLIEVEYARTIREAELTWVTGLIDEIRSGRLTWDIEAILTTLRSSS